MRRMLKILLILFISFSLVSCVEPEITDFAMEGEETIANDDFDSDFADEPLPEPEAEADSDADSDTDTSDSNPEPEVTQEEENNEQEEEQEEKAEEEEPKDIIKDIYKVCSQSKRLAIWLDPDNDGRIDPGFYLGTIQSYKGERTAKENYNYHSKGYEWSANPFEGPKPKGYESHVFFYEGSDGLSLNFYHNEKKVKGDKNYKGSKENRVLWKIITSGNKKQDKVLESDDNGELSVKSDFFKRAKKIHKRIEALTKKINKARNRLKEKSAKMSEKQIKKLKKRIRSWKRLRDNNLKKRIPGIQKMKEELEQEKDKDSKAYAGEFLYWKNTDGGVIGPFSGEDFMIRVSTIENGDNIEAGFYSANGSHYSLKHEDKITSFIISFESYETCLANN